MWAQSVPEKSILNSIQDPKTRKKILINECQVPPASAKKQPAHLRYHVAQFLLLGLWFSPFIGVLLFVEQVTLCGRNSL